MKSQTIFANFTGLLGLSKKKIPNLSPEVDWFALSFRNSSLLLSKACQIANNDGLKLLLFFFFFVGLWSQSADKLTIHSLPCSWRTKIICS
jgi:hypothetical protein